MTLEPMHIGRKEIGAVFATYVVMAGSLALYHSKQDSARLAEAVQQTDLQASPAGVSGADRGSGGSGQELSRPEAGAIPDRPASLPAAFSGWIAPEASLGLLPGQEYQNPSVVVDILHGVPKVVGADLYPNNPNVIPANGTVYPERALETTPPAS